MTTTSYTQRITGKNNFTLYKNLEEVALTTDANFYIVSFFPSHWVKNDGRLLGKPYDVEKLKTFCAK
jgi:hypothetical protein